MRQNEKESNSHKCKCKCNLVIADNAFKIKKFQKKFNWKFNRILKFKIKKSKTKFKLKFELIVIRNDYPGSCSWFSTSNDKFIKGLFTRYNTASTNTVRVHKCWVSVRPGN